MIDPVNPDITFPLLSMTTELSAVDKISTEKELEGVSLRSRLNNPKPSGLSGLTSWALLDVCFTHAVWGRGSPILKSSMYHPGMVLLAWSSAMSLNSITNSS